MTIMLGARDTTGPLATVVSSQGVPVNTHGTLIVSRPWVGTLSWLGMLQIRYPTKISILELPHFT